LRRQFPSPKWTLVQGFGSIKYFNVSYLVLLIVPLLAGLQQKFPHISSFVPDLRLTYASSIFYAIAILLYRVFCPPEISRFGNDRDEYIRTHLDMHLRALPNRRYEILLANLDPNLDKQLIDRVLELVEAKNLAHDPRSKLHEAELENITAKFLPDAVQRYLLKKYSALNESFPLARWAAFVLYSSGTAVLSYLIVYNSFRVFSFGG
jgi:hypothetical protein